jgi:hypothetical protein
MIRATHPAQMTLTPTDGPEVRTRRFVLWEPGSTEFIDLGVVDRQGSAARTGTPFVLASGNRLGQNIDQ